MQLSTKVFIGFALGILLGLIFKEKILVLKPLGDLFLRLIKMIVVPLVFFSIISGITSMGDIQKLRKVGTKTLIYYIITTGIAGIIGIIVARALKPGAGFVLDQVTQGSVEMKAVPKLSEVILNMVPINPFASLVKGDLMQVIIFSIFLGVGITLAGKKAEKFKDIFDAGSQAMYKVTNIVMEFSPIGVTALIASSVGEYGLKIFGPLGKFILADYVAMLAVLFILYSLMLKFIAKISVKDFYRIMPKIWAVTASTTSSSGTLPITIKVSEEDFNVKEELASFTLPLGATMNMNGAVGYLAVATIFVAQIYGIEITISQQAMLILMTTLIAVGAPGIPGGGIVLTVMLLGTMGLPADIMGLIAGIYRIIDMGHTSLNVTGDVVSTLCIARSENMFKSKDLLVEK
ncbi:dicarboxylate/amino acid:cation symporter [Wukongibacter sp. M2B1]|uniref:dicarboxylate/amino acid:cation symporter n=1 Tax=Wukongibacter sp. M2B1 TaxID=3088895 RepID=UPI003D7A60E7